MKNPIFRRSITIMLTAGSLTMTPLHAQTQSTESLGLIPKPVSLELRQGAFTLTAGTRILASPNLETEAQNLSHRLGALTGLPLLVVRYYRGQAAGPAIVLDLQPSLDSTLGTEGYQLSVQANQIVIKAPSTAGIFYGGITLSQLVSNASVPCVEITDYPRFAWRGMMIDSSRHFKSKEFIERFLDLMAMQKMNHFHWHLVDSEGWRREIKKYPKLTQISQDFPASYPSEDPSGVNGKPTYQYGHFHGGGYYTQEDVKEIVAYAAARHIEIMPEIEFPGHSMAALVAYPEFSTRGKSPSEKSNISQDLYNVDDNTLQFLREVLTEVMDIFPGKFLHFGGDEAPKQQWKGSPFVQAKIKALGLKNEDALQSWLFEQMAEFVAKRGRRAVGWQEIIEGGIPKSAVVMPWIGMGPGIKAANNGNDVIVATTFPNYFDSYETDSPLEPAGYYGGITLAAVYNQTFDYPEIRPEYKKHILGAQAQLWAELMPKPADVEYKAFPRSSALAEALWTPQGKKDFADFSRRLVVMAHRWDRFTPPVNYHYLRPAPFARWTPETLAGSAGAMDFTITSPDDLRSVSSGSCAALFQYSGGSQGLGIHKVELVADGRVIASDAHEGFTGNDARRNLYRFNFSPSPDIANTAKMSLRVDASGTGKDSHGDITLIGGKVLEQYNPVNYPLGTVPLGFWQASDLAAPSKPITIPLTRAIKQAGTYQVELRNTGGNGTFTVKKLAIVQNGVEMATLSPDVPCGADQKSTYLSLTLDNIDPSSPFDLQISTEAPAGTDSNGEVWITKMVKLDAYATYQTGSGAVLAKWSPDKLGGDGFVTAHIDLPAGAIDKPGTYHLTFQYTSGACAAHFKDVKLLANSVVVATDVHEGDSGNSTHNNKYALKVDSIPAAGTAFSIQFQIKGDGGPDSNGDIRLSEP